MSEDPHFLGGFAEYCYILPGTFILKLPPELSDEEATPINCGVATMAAVTEAAAIGLGDAVVIQGLGLLGLYGAAMAKARGARCVIGLDAVPARLEIAKKFGVDLAVDISSAAAQTVAAQVRALCTCQSETPTSQSETPMSRACRAHESAASSDRPPARLALANCRALVVDRTLDWNRPPLIATSSRPTNRTR